MRAAENSASATLNLDEARDVVLALAPDVLAEFETRLAEFDSGERKIGCEAAIEYAADFLSSLHWRARRPALPGANSKINDATRHARVAWSQPPDERPQFPAGI
jgi:hypothetical protein